MPAVETSPPRERLESEEARLDSPPRIASAPLRMGSAASPLRRTGTAASTRSSPGRPSVPMDVPKADIELPSENRSPTRAQRRGYAYGLPTTTASETMRAAAAAAGVSSELDNSSSAARGRGRGEIGDAQLMPPREGVAAGRAARRGGAEAMASHPALAAAMSEPYLAALLQRVPLQPDAAQQQMLDEHASASAARAAATRKRRAMHAALATTRLGVDNIIAVAHGASRPRRAVTNGIDSTPFYRDSRARAQRRREKGVKAELSFGAKPGVGFSRQSRFAAGTRLDCAVTLTSAALPTAGERVFDPSSAEAKAKGMSAAARSSALLSAAASVSPLRRGFKVRHVAGEEAAVLARRERRRAHAVALTESTRTKSDNVAWEMGVLQLANHAGAPRETHAHYRWQFDRDMKRKKPRREIYGDALGDGQSAAYGSASPVRGRGLSASQQWGSMAKGAVGSSVRSRWGGVGPIHGVGEKAKSLVQHLGIEIGSTPGGRFASRDVRFDPNNPLFPEVAMLRGMGGLGVPSRTQVHGPRGFFRKDPISIEASAQRARARGEANAARTANANAMKLSRPLELAPDGTLKEFSPEKIPYLGSSTARIGSVEFYRGNDVSAPLQSNPSVSGRVPHGTSVEEMMHGGAAGRPIAAAVRDGGGASASFCATRRAPLWSDRQVSRPTASNRPGVGNAVPEAEEHLREIDLAKIDISGSSARRFERWRQERIRVAEDARIVVGGAKWNRARVERYARFVREPIVGKHELNPRFDQRPDAPLVGDATMDKTHALHSNHHPAFDRMTGFTSKSPRFATQSFYANGEPHASHVSSSAHVVRAKRRSDVSRPMKANSAGFERSSSSSSSSRTPPRQSSVFAATAVRNSGIFAAPKPLWEGKYRATHAVVPAGSIAPLEKAVIAKETKRTIKIRKAKVKQAMIAAAKKDALHKAHVEELKREADLQVKREKAARRTQQIGGRASSGRNSPVRPDTADILERANADAENAAVKKSLIKKKKDSSNGWTHESASGFDPMKMMDYDKKKKRRGAGPTAADLEQAAKDEVAARKEAKAKAAPRSHESRMKRRQSVALQLKRDKHLAMDNRLTQEFLNIETFRNVEE